MHCLVTYVVPELNELLVSKKNVFKSEKIGRKGLKALSDKKEVNKPGCKNCVFFWIF